MGGDELPGGWHCIVHAANTLVYCWQGDLRAGDGAGAQEVLDALAAACGRGAGRPLANWAAVSFRAAGALRMTPADAAALGARQCLRLLLMQGPLAAEVSEALFTVCAAAPCSCTSCLPPLTAPERHYLPILSSYRCGQHQSRQIGGSLVVHASILVLLVIMYAFS